MIYVITTRLTVRVCSHLLPGGVAATDIPRFPELNAKGSSGYQPPRKRLGLDRRQMCDTIAAATGAMKIQISLSSRRHERHIAQMQTVKAGGRGIIDYHAVTTDQISRERWSDRP